MRTPRSLRLAGLALVMAVAVLPAARAGDPVSPRARGPKAARTAVDPVPLDYKHDAVPPGKDEAAAPSVPDVPDELKVASHSAPRVEASRRTVPSGTSFDPADLGTQSGENMALEAVRVWGWRQYWRAGFGRGMHEALADPRPVAWGRADGLRSGRLDLRAQAIGGQMAQDAAADAAQQAAESRVRTQFLDLSREPRRDRGGPMRPGDPARYFAAGPWAVAPVYDDVFAAVPLSSAPGLDRDAHAALDGWQVQAAALGRDPVQARAYDANWKDSAYAFSVWRDRQRPGSYWSRFGPGERETFRTAFFARFDDVLGSIDLRPTYAGWRVGYADGWRYGVAVNREWGFRQGYASGFDDGVRAAATLAFPFLFDRAYGAAYDAEFAAWQANAVPALGALSVVDGNDDGVIEPGERLALSGEVVNYGGAPGTFELRAVGSAVMSPVSESLRLPARGRVPVELAQLVVDGSVAPRTKSELDVTIADDRASVPIYVARPLEIDGDPSISADPLGGRVRMVVTVANRSRRPLEAEAMIAPADAGSRDARRDRLSIPAGGSARMEASFDGVRPLDLLAGTARWEASVRHDGVENDARAIAVPAVATDLGDPALVTYMVGLARGRDASASDVRGARGLMLDRMRADWERAIAADGNPYKRDYDDGSASTALGELVRAVGEDRKSFANRSVFSGMGSDISALADTLPGAHPLLRKWMKRLAKQVG